MTIYRVGDEGAVVFDTKGKPLARLRPGWTVVPGSIDQAGRRLETDAKRLEGYENKVIRPTEDKSR